MEIAKENRIIVIISSLFVFLFLWINISEIQLIKNLKADLESPFVESRIIINRSPWIKKNSNISIIDIDHKSLEKLGQWPWSGEKLKLLLNKLINSGVSLICFDLVFSKKGHNSAAEVHKLYSKMYRANSATLKTLSELTVLFNYDAQFSNLLREHEAITGFIYHKKLVASSGYLPPPLPVKNKIHQRAVISAVNFSANIKSIQEASKFGGFINIEPDQDGIFRRTPLIIRYGQNLYPALSLQVARVHQVTKKLKITHDENNAEALKAIYIDELKVPLERKLKVMPTYRGPKGSFPIYSALDVINEKINLSALERKIVIIGSSEPHIRPAINTLAGKRFMTAEIHANLLNGILTNQLLTRPAWSVILDNLVILVIGLGLSVVLPMLRLREAMLLCTLIGLTWVIYNYWMYTNQFIITAIAIPILLLTVLATTNVISKYEPIRFRLIRLFANLLYKLRLHSSMSEKEKRDETTIEETATVMFLEIRNFTEYSDKLDSSRLNRMLNLVVGPISHIIESLHGQLSQYVGHMLIASWRTGHAIDAVTASQLIIRQCAILNPKLKQKGFPEIQVNIGINTGKIRFKTLSFNTSILCGQTVAVANKLAELTQFYQLDCLVGQRTRSECESYRFREIDIYYHNPTQIYSTIKIHEPIVAAEEMDILNFYELGHYEKALEYLHQNKLLQARNGFSYLHQLRPKTAIYKLYLSRLESLAKNEKKEWTGPLNRRHFIS